MKGIINGGIYEVNLRGSHDSEFNGPHPSIILRNLKEDEIYYIIPLTTYDKGKWEKLRKNLCCRIPSTNSIARIDKMQVRHKDSIPQRWHSANRLLYPTTDEIKSVYEHLEDYISLSIQKSLKEYEKHYNNYLQFKQLCSDLFVSQDFSQFTLDFQDEQLTIKCDMNLANDLTLDDVKDAIREHIPRKSFAVSYDKPSQQLIIKVSMQEQLALTLKAHYDKIMPAEERS